MEHLKAWNAVSAILTAARVRHDDPSAVLDRIKADLDAADHTLRSSVEFVQVRQRVIAGLQSTYPQAVQNVIDDLVRFVTTRRESQESLSARHPNR